MATDIAKLADALYEAGCIRFGEFTLKDGSIAPIYIDLRVLVGEPKTLRLLASMIAERLGEFEFDVITGIPYAALPIGVAVSLEADLPLVYARDKPKAYGTRHQVEGKFEEGQRVLVIDDVITSGGSKVEAAQSSRTSRFASEKGIACSRAKCRANTATTIPTRGVAPGSRRSLPLNKLPTAP